VGSSEGGLDGAADTVGAEEIVGCSVGLAVVGLAVVGLKVGEAVPGGVPPT